MALSNAASAECSASVGLLKRARAPRAKPFGSKAPAVLTQRQILGSLRDHLPVLGGHVVERDELRLDDLKLGHDSIGERGQFLSRDPSALEPVHCRVIAAGDAVFTFLDAGHFTADIGKASQRRRKCDNDGHRRRKRRHTRDALAACRK